MFQFFPLFHARRAQSTEQSRARARRSHRKPRRAPAPGVQSSRQLPTNMKLFLHCESLVICPADTLAQLSLVSRKRGRVADVAVITRARALSGAGDQAVFYFPWSHAADDTATNPCVWEREKFYLTNFLSNISFLNHQLRSTINMWLLVIWV